MPRILIVEDSPTQAAQLEEQIVLLTKVKHSDATPLPMPVPPPDDFEPSYAEDRPEDRVPLGLRRGRRRGDPSGLSELHIAGVQFGEHAQRLGAVLKRDPRRTEPLTGAERGELLVDKSERRRVVIVV